MVDEFFITCPRCKKEFSSKDLHYESTAEKYARARNQIDEGIRILIKQGIKPQLIHIFIDSELAMIKHESD